MSSLRGSSQILAKAPVDLVIHGELTDLALGVSEAPVLRLQRSRLESLNATG